MEREYIGEAEPPPVVEPISEPPPQSDEERLERLLRGVVHTILATYRLEGGRRMLRRQRGARWGRLRGMCAGDSANS